MESAPAALERRAVPPTVTDACGVEGAHEWMRFTCTRPVGHRGDHQDAAQNARWPVGGGLVTDLRGRPLLLGTPPAPQRRRRDRRPGDLALVSPLREENQADVTETGAGAEPSELERQEWEQQAERERRQFEARLKPVPEFGEGYQMAEWPGTGRYYLVYEGERIGHATKTAFGTQWEAYTGIGTKVPGSRTYKTRRDALVQVAVHHQHTTRTRPKKRRR